MKYNMKEHHCLQEPSLFWQMHSVKLLSYQNVMRQISSAIKPTQYLVKSDIQVRSLDQCGNMQSLIIYDIHKKTLISV